MAAGRPTHGRVSPPPRASELQRRPVVASLVLYRLTADDVNELARRHAAEVQLFKHSLGVSPGIVPSSGDSLPMIVTFAGESEIRGQVVLDGHGRLWVKTRHQGDDRGQWRWPDAELSESTED